MSHKWQYLWLPFSTGASLLEVQTPLSEWKAAVEGNTASNADERLLACAGRAAGMLPMGHRGGSFSQAVLAGPVGAGQR